MYKIFKKTECFKFIKYAVNIFRDPTSVDVTMDSQATELRAEISTSV